MSQRWSEMKYDFEQDRWTINLRGRWYGLHCGEGFELVLGERTIPCRLELDLQWYIVMPGARLNLRTRDTYKFMI